MVVAPHLLEDLLALLVELVVDGQHALRADGLADGPRDGLDALLERLLVRQALRAAHSGGTKGGRGRLTACCSASSASHTARDLLVARLPACTPAEHIAARHSPAAPGACSGGRAPPPCRARRPAGCTARRKCRSCTRSRAWWGRQRARPRPRPSQWQCRRRCQCSPAGGSRVHMGHTSRFAPLCCAVLHAACLCRALEHGRCVGVARTWWTAKEQLMPAPLTDLPCSYRLRTDGPMPCAHRWTVGTRRAHTMLVGLRSSGAGACRRTH